MPRHIFVADLAGYFVVTNTVALGLVVTGGMLPDSFPWHAMPLFLLAAFVGNAAGLRCGALLPVETFRALVIALVIGSGAAAVLFA
ncbi:hypothetical protein ACXYTP_12810 [Tsukamurella ocularis]|uniref:hypothetical protein n=1 Tax=Tsukamurella ocularis TaxID=1970234 RepID=UPI0039F10BA2